MRQILERLINSKAKIFFILLLCTPMFWGIILQPNKLINEWKQTPVSFKIKIDQLFHDQQEGFFVAQLRWDTPSYHRSYRQTHFFYSLATVIISEASDTLSLISPKRYFQMDDGYISPPKIEPLPVVLFPFWLAGVFFLIKTKRYLVFVASFGLAVITFVLGHINFCYLFPIALINLYIANEGIFLISSPKKRAYVLILTVFYSTYLLGRTLWVVS